MFELRIKKCLFQLRPDSAFQECGHNVPSMSANFSQETIDITFQSDISVAYRGAEIQYTIDDVTGQGMASMRTGCIDRLIDEFYFKYCSS